MEVTMQDPRQISEAEFEKILKQGLATMEGPKPEEAVRIFDDLIVRACEEMQPDDELAIDLRMQKGRALWISGSSGKAVSILEAALADAVRTLGWKNRLSLSCAGNLCRALGRAKRFQEAFAIAIPLYKYRVEVFGELDNGTLYSLGHISQLLYEAGDYPRAIELMSALYEKRCTAFGESDYLTQQSASNLAAMTAAMNHYKKSTLSGL
jgi:hypothetical protein